MIKKTISLGCKIVEKYVFFKNSDLWMVYMSGKLGTDKFAEFQEFDEPSNCFVDKYKSRNYIFTSAG